MIGYRATGVFVCLGLILFLQACTTVPTTKTTEADWLARYESRVSEFSELKAWTLEGRLAVNDGSDGGSGKLRWQEESEARRMDFHGAMGRGAWRMISTQNGAELELADGRSFQAATVGELVRGQIGWSVPVESLSWWVLGLQAPGPADARSIEEDGTLSALSQQGWGIEFDRYREVDGINMPHKITARQAEKSVKLAVRQWGLGTSRD